MKRLLSAVTMGAAVFLSVFGYQNCGQFWGTDTGNPMSPASGISQSPLENSICDKLYSCFSVRPTGCPTLVRFASGFAPELGLSPGLYPNLNSIEAAIGANTLKRDASLFSACKSALAATSCADPNVQSSYSAAQPENVDNVHRIISGITSCHDMITTN